jgi:hypothetical protein
MFDTKHRLSFSRIPLLRSKITIYRVYLTIPFCPAPELDDLVNMIHE